MNEISNITPPTAATMTTREIADLVDKRHDNVMRDTKGMFEALEMSALSFEGSYIGENGKALPLYNLPRDLTMTLVTGYSIPLRKKVIDRLDEMERRAADPASILNDPAALRGLLGNYAERVEVLEAMRAADAPKVEFHEKFVEHDGLYTLQNGGRIVTGRPNKFIQELKKEHLFYQGGDLVPYVRYRQQGLFEVKVDVHNDRARSQTYLTPKGVQYFAEKFGKAGGNPLH